MKRAFTLIELIVVLAIVGILWAILIPVFSRTHCYEGRRPRCQLNLKQIGLGILLYSNDHGERLPPIASNAVASSATPYGWADAIWLYTQDPKIFQCPSEKTSTDAGADGAAPGFTDYYFNTNFDRRALKSVPNPATTLLCGEGNDGRDGTDARYNRNSLPGFWAGLKDSPARRHLDLANYLFADGHVKALKPELVKSERHAAAAFSFAP